MPGRHFDLYLSALTRNSAPWPALTTTMTRSQGTASRLTHLLYALPARRDPDNATPPTASQRARTHVPLTHPASDAVSGGPAAPSSSGPTHTRTHAARARRRGGCAPTAAVPTAATAALSRCVPCSWYPKWYPSTWRQTAPRSQTPCTHRPHSRPERRRSSRST